MRWENGSFMTFWAEYLYFRPLRIWSNCSICKTKHCFGWKFSLKFFFFSQDYKILKGDLCGGLSLCLRIFMTTWKKKVNIPKAMPCYALFNKYGAFHAALKVIKTMHSLITYFVLLRGGLKQRFFLIFLINFIILD